MSDTRAKDGGFLMDEDLLVLASLAGRSLASAAGTDAWELMKRGMVRLFRHSGPERSQLTERRLEQSRGQLVNAPESELGDVRAEIEATWRTRLLDLLEENPDARNELRALLDHISSGIPPSEAPDVHAVAADRDITITASGGGVAAGMIHGDVNPGNPTIPGSAR
jgi:hypothetical protein